MSLVTENTSRNASEIQGHSIDAIWHKSAPPAVRKAYQAGRESAGWKAWRRHLRERQRPCEQAAPIAFGKARSFDAKNLQRWLIDAETARFTRDYAMSALGWCNRLPKLAEELPAGTWWKLLDHLLQAVADAARAENAEDEPLLRQLLAGELGLMLAHLFPEITLCRALLSEARRVLALGLDDMLDGRGLLHARYFDQFRPLLACWTRSFALGGKLQQGCWGKKVEKQYRKLVRNALRFARRDGSSALSLGTTDQEGTKLLEAAVALSGSKTERLLATILGFRGKKTSKKHRHRSPKLPRASVHSEWAATAALRTDWSRSSPRLTVLYPDASCRVEFGCGKDVLCSGDWAFDLRVDGAAAVPAGEWTKQCWVSDKDMDYLELELVLNEGIRVQRHFLLAREDRFLLLADAVLSPRMATISYCGALPLAPGVTVHHACETRECWLTGGKPRATILPLALPEWRSDVRIGELMSTDSNIELRHCVTSRALWAPLFIDLDRRRLDKPLTWRSLTIGEAREVQTPDAAVGYRVAIDKKQWLLYRSLTEPRSRSLLGHNLRSETLVARFHGSGEIEPLIEVE